MNHVVMLGGDGAACVIDAVRADLSADEVRCLSDKGRLFPLFGGRFLLLSLIKENPKGNVIRAIDCRDLAAPKLCVIKEANPTYGIDEYGRDACQRLRHEANILHTLQGLMRVPEVYGQFEIDGRGYLATEYIRGTSLDLEIQIPWVDKHPGQRLLLLATFVALIDEVSSLHAAGYVHRDLALPNIRVAKSGLVYLVDFELTYHLRASAPPFHGGTPGFLSPQQRGRVAPDTADDVYTLGANLFAVVAGCDPKPILFATHHADQLRQLCAIQGLPKDLSQLTVGCVNPRAEARPCLKALRDEIDGFRECLNKFGIEHTTKPRWTRIGPPRADFSSIARRGLEGLFSGVPMDANSSIWLSPISGAAGSLKAFQRSRNVYKGVAGILYVLCTAHRIGVQHPELAGRVRSGLAWLLATPLQGKGRSGLFFGEPGVAVAIAEAVRSKIIEKTTALVDTVHQCLSVSSDAPGVADGSAGAGIASLACYKGLQDPALLAHARDCADGLIAVCDDRLRGRSSPDFGFGRGISGIVYFLAKYASHSGDARAREACQAGAECVINLGAYSLVRSRICWKTGPKDSEPICGWFQGSAGIALMLLAVFQCTGDLRYARLANEALLHQPGNLARFPLSQEHGLSGLGEIYLEMSSVLQQDEWCGRASMIAECIESRGRPAPRDGLVWFVGDRFIPNPALMTGSAGIVHFLLKLLSPAEVPLPFLL